MSRIVARQSFDEGIFGRPFFRILDPDHPDLESEWGDAIADVPGPILGDARSDVDRVDLHRRLAALGFRRVCTQITLALPSPGAAAIPDGVQVCDTLALDPATVAAHGANFGFARFAQDPACDRSLADALMTTWIANSLGGRRQVVTDGTDFVTFAAADDGVHIDLVSVLEGGRGTGGRLMTAMVGHAAAIGAPKIVVTTEAENVPAQRLYLRLGFRPIEARACHHFG